MSPGLEFLTWDKQIIRGAQKLKNLEIPEVARFCKTSQGCGFETLKYQQVLVNQVCFSSRGFFDSSRLNTESHFGTLRLGYHIGLNTLTVCRGHTLQFLRHGRHLGSKDKGFQTHKMSRIDHEPESVY